MLYHSIKIFIRNFSKQRSYTLINIIGLAVGLSCALLIYLWIQDERSYDQFHTDVERIYQVMRERTSNSGEVFYSSTNNGLMAQALIDEYPDIDKAASHTWPSNMHLASAEKSLTKSGFFADSLWFEIFSFPFIVGNPEQALDDPNSIVLSEETALGLFGSTDKALGSTLKLLEENVEFTVTGVFENIPFNSSLQFDFIAPFQHFIKKRPWAQNPGNNSFITYVKLISNTSKKEVDTKIATLGKDKFNGEYELFLHPLAKKRLYSNFENSREAGGGITYIYLFSIIAAFVVLIACVNFMNLATARAARRSLEVGVKKVVGAQKTFLIIQFLVEAMLLTIISMILSIILSEFLLPEFNNLTGKDIDIPYSSPDFLGIVGGLICITTIAAGAYPAFYLSSFSPSIVIKGSKKTQTKSTLRKVLVIGQFTIATILIIGTVGIFKQIQYINSKNLGLDKENVIGFMTKKGIDEKTDAFRSELTQIPGVESMTYTSNNPIEIWSNTSDPTWAGKDPNLDVYFHVVSVDFNFLETFKIPLASGRDYNPNLTTDSTSYIINKKTAEIIGLDNPIGETLMFWEDTGSIIGITEDFHINSFHHPIEQLIIRVERYEPNYAFIRLSGNDMPKTIEKVGSLFKKYCPEYPFEYTFLDEEHNARYKDEIAIGKLANYFAFITIFISCLGLLGLSSYMAEQRTKEIGVRKTLGASITSLVIMFSKGFMSLIGVAYIIALPFGYYILESFLENYAYKATIGIEIYLLVGVVTAFIAWGTIAFQSIRVARKNPIDSLRYE